MAGRGAIRRYERLRRGQCKVDVSLAELRERRKALFEQHQQAGRLQQVREEEADQVAPCISAGSENGCFDALHRVGIGDSGRLGAWELLF